MLVCGVCDWPAPPVSALRSWAEGVATEVHVLGMARHNSATGAVATTHWHARSHVSCAARTLHHGVCPSGSWVMVFAILRS